jgi:hypothetical protein
MKIRVSKHALERLRERWSGAACMEDQFLSELLLGQIKQADTVNDAYDAPGGRYYPISLQGEDGYAVVKEGEVKTVMPTEYCMEVDKVRNGRKED